jgi:Endonuclease/Exonuclease/phosphatase family
MKIATFNVNGVNGRLPVLMRWLAEAKPDVVCLQELKAPDGKFPEPTIREAGYRAVWHGQKSWNGVAILARNRTPMETRRGLPGDLDDAHSRYSRPPGRGGRGRAGARLGEGERSCADLDRARGCWPEHRSAAAGKTSGGLWEG